MFTRAPFSLSPSLKQFAVCLFGISSLPACLAHSHGRSFSSPVRLSVSRSPPLSADRRPRCQYTPAEVCRSYEIVARLSVVSVRTDQHPPKHNNFGMLHVNATQTFTISEGNFWYFQYFVWKPVEANLQKIVRDPDCSSIRGQHLSCLQTVGIDATSCV